MIWARTFTGEGVAGLLRKLRSLWPLTGFVGIRPVAFGRQYVFSRHAKSTCLRPSSVVHVSKEHCRLNDSHVATSGKKGTSHCLFTLATSRFASLSSHDARAKEYVLGILVLLVLEAYHNRSDNNSKSMWNPSAFETDFEAWCHAWRKLTSA